MSPADLRPKQALMRCLPAALALLALVACESDRSSRRDGDSDAARPDAAKAAPEMEAEGTFFSGQIVVEVVLNRTGFGGRGGGKSDGGGGASGAGGGHGGGGGGHRHGGGGGGSPAAVAGDSDAAPQIRPSSLPAVGLHLRLTNHGQAPAEVDVTDFNSDLGNFVVEPEKFALPPNGSVEAEPMISQLGVSSDAIPLSVSMGLRGPGETRLMERQVLVLRIVKPAAPPAQAPQQGS